MHTLKTCNTCGVDKALAEFYRVNKNGTDARCKPCRKQWRKDRYDLNPLHHRDKQLRSKYGISLDQFNDLMEAQGGVCAICRRAETYIHPKAGTLNPLCVDHDHTTEKVRGLLCWKCNAGLGLFNDSRGSLLAAARYLEDSH